MELINFITHLDTQIAGFISVHGNLIYLVLFAIVFLEIGICPLFFLPGNPLIFIAGSFCKLGSLHLQTTIITLILANILGNFLSYNMGKMFTKRIQQNQLPWINQSSLNKTRNFYTKYGQYTLTLSPFIAVVRTFAPLLAGVSEMPLQKYLISSSIGGIAWVLVLVLCGYFLSSLAIVEHHMASIVLTGLAIGLGFVVFGFIKSKTRK